jgi:hypothetical protein
MAKPQTTAWANRWNDFGRKHPWVLALFVFGLTFLAAPLMVAATKLSAVLYQDF